MPVAPQRSEHSISMWGAPASGKTTFLAALSIALNRQETGWTVTGANDVSERELIKLTAALGDERQFPKATAGIDRYNWVLSGSMPVVTRRIFRTKQVIESARIGLDFVDPTGELAGPDKLEISVRRDLINLMARSKGIVYVFDPISEFEKGNAFGHTFGMVVQLARRLAETDGFTGGRLPHYLAVCITKFDDIRVFETAAQSDLIRYRPDDPYGFPRVDGENARKLFLKLCEVSKTGNAELVLNALERYFRKDRIRYFASSAIGFYIDPRIHVYDSRDPQNLLPYDKEPKKGRIRGSVHPINVVEPLLWISTALLSEPLDTGNGTRP